METEPCEDFIVITMHVLNVSMHFSSDLQLSAKHLRATQINGILEFGSSSLFVIALESLKKYISYLKSCAKQKIGMFGRKFQKYFFDLLH